MIYRLENLENSPSSQGDLGLSFYYSLSNKTGRCGQHLGYCGGVGGCRKGVGSGENGWCGDWGEANKLSTSHWKEEN